MMTNDTVLVQNTHIPLCAICINYAIVCILNWPSYVVTECLRKKLCRSQHRASATKVRIGPALSSIRLCNFSPVVSLCSNNDHKNHVCRQRDAKTAALKPPWDRLNDINHGKKRIFKYIMCLPTTPSQTTPLH